MLPGMMGYKASFSGVSVSAAVDSIEIVMTAATFGLVTSIDLGQSSDSGDAEAEHLIYRINRATTSGSGGTTVTPRPNMVVYPAFPGTVEANNTTQATGLTEIAAGTFPIALGLQLQHIPIDMLWIPPSGRLVIEIEGPNDALTMSGTVGIALGG